jgi:hypothetical protein
MTDKWYSMTYMVQHDVPSHTHSSKRYSKYTPPARYTVCTAHPAINTSNRDTKSAGSPDLCAYAVTYTLISDTTRRYVPP